MKKVGDIIINPYVSKMFNDKLNPNYATIYIGNNKTVDYNGRILEWCDKVYKDDRWKVIGHHDFDLRGVIENALKDGDVQ